MTPREPSKRRRSWLHWQTRAAETEGPQTLLGGPAQSPRGQQHDSVQGSEGLPHTCIPTLSAYNAGQESRHVTREPVPMERSRNPVYKGLGTCVHVTESEELDLHASH